MGSIGIVSQADIISLGLKVTLQKPELKALDRYQIVEEI